RGVPRAGGGGVGGALAGGSTGRGARGPWARGRLAPVGGRPGGGGVRRRRGGGAAGRSPGRLPLHAGKRAIPRGEGGPCPARGRGVGPGPVDALGNDDV